MIPLWTYRKRKMLLYSWEVFWMLRKKGGLSLGNWCLKLLFLCLKVKVVFSFWFDSLWHNLIKSKYGLHYSVWEGWDQHDLPMSLVIISLAFPLSLTLLLSGGYSLFLFREYLVGRACLYEFFFFSSEFYLHFIMVLFFLLFVEKVHGILGMKILNDR